MKRHHRQEAKVFGSFFKKNRFLPALFLNLRPKTP